LPKSQLSNSYRVVYTLLLYGAYLLSRPHFKSTSSELCTVGVNVKCLVWTLEWYCSWDYEICINYCWI